MTTTNQTEIETQAANLSADDLHSFYWTARSAWDILHANRKDLAKEIYQQFTGIDVDVTDSFKALCYAAHDLLPTLQREVDRRAR